MKKVALRLVSLLLIAAVLTGCGSTPAEKTGPVQRETQPETAPPAEAVQTQMPEETLAQALTDIDMAVLCAAYAANYRVELLTNPGLFRHAQVVAADYNHDGFRDVLIGNTNHITYTLHPERKATFVFAQSSPTYYTDDTGTVYRYDGMGDGFDIEIDGKPAWVDYLYGAYQKWENDRWVTDYSYDGQITYMAEDDGLREIENTVVAQINGKEGTKAELDAHLQQIGMKEFVTQPAAYTRYAYDRIYQDSLLESLDTYFSMHYNGYTRMLQQDIDADGEEEAVYILPDFEQTWYNNMEVNDTYTSIHEADIWFRYDFPEEYSHTGIVIADPNGDELEITAHCALQYFQAYEGMQIRMEGGNLWLDNTCIQLNGRFAGIPAGDVPAELISYMSEYGYSGQFFRKVDVSDFDGDEYLCVCQKDGVWYVFIIVIMDGDPVVLYSTGLWDNGVYLTEYEGEQCLLTYYQAVYPMDDQMVTQYSYNIERINLNGGTKSLDYAYVNYTDQDQDATKVAEFFEELNGYLIRIIVVRDPYKLTGSMWMPQEEVEQGTAPQETPAPTETPDTPEEPEQEAVLGFVDIKNPASWLHLRVGPGTEYDKVLMDPADPDSYVRQAKGSPVTVLETIETEDPENPVWVKIRITYGDRELVGYSSKTYIRLLDE